MLGCCILSQIKFRTSDGLVKEGRLATVVEAAQKDGAEERDLEKAKSCDCDCHVLGKVCLC